MNDGSVLQGTVKGATNGKLTLETTFAGTLSLALDQIAQVTTDETFNVELASGNRLVGNLRASDQSNAVETQYGAIPIGNDTIVNIWAPGTTPPEVSAVQAQQRKWQYEANFDLSGRSGNTDRVSLAGGAKATLAGPDDTLLFYLRKQYAETDNEKSVDETIVGIDFERRFLERHSWYVRAEGEKDDIEQLDLRTTGALGYGYYFLRSKTHELRGRLGAFYRHEAWEQKENESTYGADLGLRHMYVFTDRARMVNEIVFTPSLEDTSNYRVWHESSIEFPLTSERMKMALGVSNEYNTPVPDGVDELDTYYFARLILTWR